MMKVDDFVPGTPMKDLYDAWKVEYTADPNSAATIEKDNHYRAIENQRLTEATLQNSYKTAIRNYYSTERALKAATDAQAAGLVRS